MKSRTKMRRPSYCTRPSVSDCWHCSLTNYGRDCRNVSITAREDGARGGAIGGRSTSEAKRSAAASNGKKGGRPRKKK